MLVVFQLVVFQLVVVDRAEIRDVASFHPLDLTGKAGSLYLAGQI
ncbi:MAG TPA: hypothetical protein VFZ15_03725 [Acidimicrobiia bacterium]|nr:hypothetical protein [Acidimicrobiia bacterium]